jgi:tetratricopeptide (TPR) repeat protein
MTTVRKAGNEKELAPNAPLGQQIGTLLRRAGTWCFGWVFGRSRGGADELRSDPKTLEERVHLLLRRGRVAAAAGDFREGLAFFEQALVHLPDCSEAIEARAALLDLTGEVDRASREFERYRRLSASTRIGTPDRHYVLRHRRSHTDMAEYEVVVRRVKNRVFPLVAQGNLLLTRGYAAEALAYYDYALRLKKEMIDVVLLRGCALSALGKHAEAIACFDEVLTKQPDNRDALNSRGIARTALGLLDQADADWRRQFDLLPPSKADARACIALRLADHELAQAELANAIAAQPTEAYWPLYRLAALRRLGRDGVPAGAAASGAWPAPLLALHAGTLDEVGLLARADNPRRRAEAAYQLGVLAFAQDRSTAVRWWNEVVERAPADMIEYAAARKELSRLG